VAQPFDLADIANSVPRPSRFFREPALSGAEGAGVGNAGGNPEIVHFKLL